MAFTEAHCAQGHGTISMFVGHVERYAPVMSNVSEIKVAPYFCSECGQVLGVVTGDPKKNSGPAFPVHCPAGHAFADFTAEVHGDAVVVYCPKCGYIYGTVAKREVKLHRGPPPWRL